MQIKNKGGVLLIFSKNLLNNQEIAEGLFNATVDKSIKYLREILGEDFFILDPDGEIEKELDKYKFEAVFNFNERCIHATISLEEEKEDLLKEVLRLKEEKEKIIIVNYIPGSYKDAINNVVDILEQTYNLNFTPLDPSYKDKNIRDIKENKNKGYWKARFLHDDIEGEIEALFTFNENEGSTLIVKEYKNYIIYLD